MLSKCKGKKSKGISYSDYWFNNCSTKPNHRANILVNVNSTVILFFLIEVQLIYSVVLISGVLFCLERGVI